ncbi:MAG: bifunctional (p)ppGpp synthetase/guanosine-3',5'-bis(diphosphate) 3'-pyrophosphohydrolase, partial [Erysipelotrichaceae bacterium]|nr:bifunctional (p)ppGpp synthetase/guanosine-3',5'-bis(diphosphate) 3'-pyrophosphohydrolase [Erysipelotrichaceae bacterium]
TNSQKHAIGDTETLAKKFNHPDAKKKVTTTKGGLKVSGIDSMMISLAQCCNPVYGDDIVGYITKGQGVKVHRCDCQNVKGHEKRLIDVMWEEEDGNKSYQASVMVLSKDRNFLLTDIVTVVSQCKASLQSITSTVNNEDLTATTHMIITVSDLDHLKLIMANLRKVDSVLEVEREDH